MTSPRRLDEVVAGYTPKPVTVKVCPDGDLVSRYQETIAALDQARQARDRELQAELDDKVDQLRAELAEASVEFRFVGLGRKAWSDLLGEHPPTKEQLRTDPRADHNPATFPQAAIAASLVEPEGATQALVERIWETWPFGECEKLWGACLKANHGTNSVPF